VESTERSESHLGPKVNESEVDDDGSRTYGAMVEPGTGANMADKLKLPLKLQLSLTFVGLFLVTSL
jgi:hypothetical protein